MIGRPAIDRKPFLAQSVCGVLMASSLSPIKKGLFILAAVVLAPVVLVGVVALAANDWRQIGATAAGDQVLVSASRRGRTAAHSLGTRRV